MLLHTDNIYTYETFNNMLDDIGELPIVKKRVYFKDENDKRQSRTQEYYNIPAAYDTETSAFMDNKGRKCGITYAFMIGINGYVCLIREWYHFIDCIKQISKRYKTEYEKRYIIIYVHNLAYEFQFMRKRFTFNYVFAVDERKPIYAITADGIEFRDSYILSAATLANVGDNLTSYSIRKAVGDLDYKLIRHSLTPLTDLEVKYCVNDVFVVMAYIQEQIKEYGSIDKIPLTNTGRVREFTRKRCMKNKGYHSLMRRLVINDTNELLQLKRAFAGGFTHANSMNVGHTFNNVYSMDLCSAYPAVMLYAGYPMSRGYKKEVKSEKQLWYFLNNYCCVFDAEFTQIEVKGTPPDHYISSSKCSFCEGNKYNDNGRLVAADKIRITLTDVDFKIIKQWYGWKGLKVNNFTIYQRGYLPKEIVECVLELYKNKTELKDVADRVDDYQRSKGMLNSTYGMMVTDILRDVIEYLSEWNSKENDINKCLDKYNNDHTRFLFYPWGVFVTAYVRSIIWSAIKELGSDYIYSDTDSVKFLNYEKHIKWFEEFNNKVVNSLKAAMNYHGIEYEGNCNPKTIKGVEKVIGIFELDGVYKRFKTLGAKRYIYENAKGINITVSGVNKKTATPWLVNEYKDPFKAFADGLIVPPEHTGKLTHTYIDEERKGEIKDYMGNIGHYEELTAIHMEPASYELTIDGDYKEYINYVVHNTAAIIR